MQSFYYITLMVLSALFVLSLVSILYLTYTQEAQYGGSDLSKPYPPVQQKCPDKWKYDSTSKRCIATFDSTPANNLTKNLGVYVAANTGVIQESEMAATAKGNPSSLVYTAAKGTTAATVSFDPDDASFTSTTSTPCAKKNFTIDKNIYWEGYGTYNPCPLV